MDIKRKSLYRITLLAILLSAALILGFVENLFNIAPGVPGIKLGLSNVVLLFTLYTLKISDAILLMVLKVLLSGFLFGNPMTISYGLAGGALSFLGMLLTKKIPEISIVGVSMIGAVLHNTGQIILNMLIVQNTVLLSYLPVLVIVGLVTGLLTGFAAKLVLAHMKFMKT